MKNTGIYVNEDEDLTAVNAQLLASVRKKMPDEVDQAWSQNGITSYRNKMGHTHIVKYAECSQWLDLKWPDDSGVDKEAAQHVAME